MATPEAVGGASGERTKPVGTMDKIFTYPKRTNDSAGTFRHFMQIQIYQNDLFSTIAKVGSRTSMNYLADNSAGGIGRNTDAPLVNAGAVTTALSSGLLEKGAWGKMVKSTISDGVALIQANSINIKNKVTVAVGYINLYMPDTVVYDDRQEYNPMSVTDALGSAGFFKTIGDRNIGESTGETVGAAMEAAGGGNIFGQGIRELAVASTGYSLNPQMQIMYRGPKFREFKYSFKFSPRTEDEANDLNDIITTLRYHAAPQYASGDTSRYFIPPSQFRIQHMIDNAPNTRIPRIGQCVLESVSVNYASAGQYATFHDGQPIEISMDLSFAEVNVITKADIQAGF